MTCPVCRRAWAYDTHAMVDGSMVKRCGECGCFFDYRAWSGAPLPPAAPPRRIYIGSFIEVGRIAAWMNAISGLTQGPTCYAGTVSRGKMDLARQKLAEAGMLAEEAMELELNVEVSWAPMMPGKAGKA